MDIIDDDVFGDQFENWEADESDEDDMVPIQR